jgi:dihydrofolate reductase
MKIRLFFAASLDGFIADPDGGVAFLDTVEEDEDSGNYENFMSTVKTLVMGRGTYKFLEDCGEWPYGNLRTIVVTHRPLTSDLIPQLETRAVEDFSAFAAELRRTSEGDVWVVGGGQIMAQFLSVGEVDSIEMSIVPVAVGAGIPMYASRQSMQRSYTLFDCSSTQGGVARLRYERTV